MRIIDTHCDALYKMQAAKRINFRRSRSLQTNLNRLQAGNVKVQFFAIFLPPNTPSDKAWQKTLEQIDLFRSEIIGENKEMVHIKKWNQIKKLKSREIGAVLALEGAESFGNDLNKLKKLHNFGVLSVGLTWNVANLCADGVGEVRGAGLTSLGKQVVEQNDEHRVLTDVSHISEKGFWDVIERSAYPFASHSNAKKICNHPRNLNDEQIEALIEKNAQIHLVFYPPFVKDGHEATIDHLIEHIDHICSLGGKNNIGFGSDYDGIDRTVAGLEDASKYENLINELLKHYEEEEVRGFMHQNFEHFLLKMKLL